METIIVTDSCCDLPYDYIRENHIEVILLNIIINNIEKKDDLAITKEYKAFYQSIKDGAMPTTSQINAYEYKEIFEKHLKQGKNVLYIGFSSAMSGCINSAKMALEEIKEEMQDARVGIVDSKCASMGQGLLVYYAVEAFKKGMSFDEVINFLENNKLKLNHWFTVADLNHLYRGGRISKTAATLGTLLQLKPILKVSEEGKLEAVEKIKGRKKSLKNLVEKVKEHIVNSAEQVIFISHADALEDAEEVKKGIMEHCQVKDVWIGSIGAAVGSHAGPGTIAVFFMGEKRA